MLYDMIWSDIYVTVIHWYSILQCILCRLESTKVDKNINKNYAFLSVHYKNANTCSQKLIIKVNYWYRIHQVKYIKIPVSFFYKDDGNV